MTKERVEKRLTHHGKPEHGRKEYERRETVDFTHISAEVFRTVLNTGHQRHKRGREHLRERRAAHLAPFVGLGVDSQGAKRIERAYHKRVYRKENSVEHRGAEHAQPYAPHLRERALFIQHVGSQRPVAQRMPVFMPASATDCHTSAHAP